MRVALDAMGGDQAPTEIVIGALQGAAQSSDVEVLLVGDERRIGESVESYGQEAPANVRTIHAAETIEMGESPVSSVKQKRDSSIVKCVSMVADGEADAVVSAGNTGAFVAAAQMLLRRLKGVKRPGIAATFPSLSGVCTVIDVGANIKCKPEHLYQYGVMASIFARDVIGRHDPKVGLLNIGEEDAKGNELVKRTRELLSDSQLTFVGNVEGRDIFRGECDVIVCEGFVGNVVLKVSEALAENMMAMLKAGAEKDAWATLGMALCKPALDELHNRIDYSEYGGAPLLGIDGICIICHGRSDRRAIANAIREAAGFSQHEVNQQIVAAVRG